MALIFIQFATLYFLRTSAFDNSNRNGLLQSNSHDKYLEISVECLRKIIIEEEITKVVAVIDKKYLQDFELLPNLVRGSIATIKIFTDPDRPILAKTLNMWKQTTSLLFVTDENEVRSYIQKLQKQRHLSPRGYLIIISVNNTEKINYEAIGRILQEFQIMNSLILKNSPEGIQLVTNFPYKNNKCEKYSPINDEILAVCYWNGSIKFLRKHNHLDYYPPFVNSKLFPAKIPRNLERCPVKIVTGLWPPNVIDVNRQDFPGIEIDFINMIARYMNFVPEYISVNDVVGHKSKNGSWTGFMGYLETNRADIAIGSIHLDIDRDYIFDQTYWYLNNFILWIAPLASKNRKLEFLAYLVVESSLITKGVFLLSFYLVVAGVLLVSRNKNSKEMKTYSRIGEIHFILIKSFLNQPLRNLPKKIKIRWIIGTWILFSTIIAFFLQTSITSFLTAPFKPKEINSVDEILKLKLEISYEKYYDYIVKEHKLGKKLAALNKGFPVFKNLQFVAVGKSFTIADKLRTRYMAQQWVREDGKIPIWILKEESQHFDWSQIVMTKGHFLFNWINAMVTKAGNNGFWNFMVQKYMQHRKTLCYIRQKIVLYNYKRGINNTRAINKYNDGIYDAFPQNPLSEAVNKIFYPTPVTESQFLESFVVEEGEGRISFEELASVFRMFWGGLIVSIAVFILEILFYYFKKKFLLRK